MKVVGEIFKNCNLGSHYYLVPESKQFHTPAAVLLIFVIEENVTTVCIR